MGGIAQLARQAGHQVTGCDQNVYPPMSTALQANGIDLIQGYGLEQLALKPDLWIIGNAISRGNPLLEAILNEGLPYTSGPQWLSENILQGRTVVAVAGTHGKTTTTSMVTWILKALGADPGYLIGGVPGWGEQSAQLGSDPYFVIEADEYDTAFFDKRSKFVHYRPRVAILNNLEFDHADIFADLQAIETQFHHLVRTIPSEGTVIVNGAVEALQRVLARGCWSRVTTFNAAQGWQIEVPATPDKGTPWTITHEGQACASLCPPMPGQHNALNALAACLAVNTLGFSWAKMTQALESFPGVHRRQEVKGIEKDRIVIDDFAHHPTAIAETIKAVQMKYPTQRILAILEPRSNTMKLGSMKDQLTGALAGADEVFCFVGKGVQWSPEEVLAAMGPKAQVSHDLDDLVERIVRFSAPGDVLLCMSNGSFGGIHQKLLDALAQQVS